MAFAEEFMHYVSLDAEALDVLQKLHGKYKLGLISNFAIPECGWKLLDKYGLRQFFDIVIISGEINRRKPSPEIFQKALTILDIEPSKVVFVGDMPDLDVKGPKSVGMKTILIKRRPIENIDAKPDKIITNLSELLNILKD
jgi:HAD superfamily hydrolase (TIGR01549 family)